MEDQSKRMRLHKRFGILLARFSSVALHIKTDCSSLATTAWLNSENLEIDRHARDFYRKYDEGNLHELCDSFTVSHEMLCIVRSIFRHENGLWVLSDINPPKENSREYLCRALLKCGFNPIE